MALFKIFKGNASDLPPKSTSWGNGYAWFTQDDGKFYIDYYDGDETQDNPLVEAKKIRQPLNAYSADRDELGNVIKEAYASSLSFNSDSDSFALSLYAKDGTLLSTVNLVSYELSGSLSGNTYTYTLTPFQLITSNGQTTRTAISGDVTSATIPAMTGASLDGTQGGTAGLVPAPQAGAQDMFLRGDGSWVDLFSEYDAMRFKGTIGNTDSPTFASIGGLPTYGYEAGWVYRVVTAAAYLNNQWAEIGDLIIATNDGPTTDPGQVTDADWVIAQTNVDGAVYMGHSGNAIGDGTQLLTISGIGRVSESSSDVGSATQPVYLDDGAITATTYSLGASVGSGTDCLARYDSSGIITSSGHYATSSAIAINSSSIPNNTTLYVNGTSDFNGAATHITGHTYLAGTVTGSTNNTTQLVFSNNDKTTQYIALTATASKKFVINPSSSSTTGQIVFTPGGTSYFSNTGDNPAQVAINATNASTYNLYVSGTTRFAIGSSDNTIDKRLIIGSSGNRYLSIGSAGFQAYGANDATSLLYLNFDGGDVYVGGTSDSEVTQPRLRLYNSLYRAYTASDQTPMIWMNGSNYNNYLWSISSGTANGTQYYGYGLKYIGGGSGVNNSLRLIADNQNSTDITAIGINQNGQVGIGTDANTNYRVYVDGNAYIKTSLTMGASNATTNACISMISDNGTIYIGSEGSGDDSPIRGIWLMKSGSTDSGICWNANNHISMVSPIASGTTVTLAGAGLVNVNILQRYMDFVLRKNGEIFGEHWYDTGTSGANITTGSFKWREYSPNTTNDTATTGHYETYSLPTVTTGLTANAAYSILTSKNEATISVQGEYALTNYSDINTSLPTYGTFYASSSTVTSAVAGSPQAGAGYKLYNIRGYASNANTYDYQMAHLGGYVSPYIRVQTGSSTTWSKWHRFALIPSTQENTTDTASWSAVGGSTQPVYVNSSGIVTATSYSLSSTVSAGTANKLAYYSAANTIGPASTHYVSGTKIAINSTSAPTENLYVNGNARFVTAAYCGSTSRTAGTSLALQSDLGTLSLFQHGSADSSKSHGIWVTSGTGNDIGLFWDQDNTSLRSSVQILPSAKAGATLGSVDYPWSTTYTTQLRVMSSCSRYKYIYFTQYSSPNTTCGFIEYDSGNATNISSGRFYFAEYSPNSTADTGHSGYYELYRLPTVTAGKTANTSYDILTTKSTVSIAQGGTGKTTAAGIYEVVRDNGGDSRWIKKAGDTVNGTLSMSGEYSFRGNMLRKTSTTIGSWAYAPFSCVDGDGNGLFQIGVYGNKNSLSYIYIGVGNYSSTLNLRIQPDGIVRASQLYGAVWNDYAEFRETKDYVEPGRCVKETGKDTLEVTNQRLERGCEIVSDTFGFAIGETEQCKTPIASSGRVLAYPYESREEFSKHIGWPVCSGPNGTVSIMTEEEEEKYPSRIIGTISAVPEYEEWGGEEVPKVKVNGRVWIRIR